MTLPTACSAGRSGDRGISWISETNNVCVGWDGYIDASLLAGQGVYIYQAWITYSDGSKEELTGDVTFLH